MQGKVVTKSPSESWVEMTELVMPQHTNALGTVFGGVVMSWVDIAAATCAMRHATKTVVTASIDAMHFISPIKIGWIVTLKSAINFTSNSSCEIGVKVTAENPMTGEKFHTASAYLTFVALDSHGRATPIPQIKPDTPEEFEREAAARARRGARLKLREHLLARKKAD